MVPAEETPRVTVPVRDWAEMGRPVSPPGDPRGFAVHLTLAQGERFPIGIEDGSVSHRHAKIFRDGAQFKVQDLGSRNGTRLNGEPLPQSVQGKPGTAVTIPEERSILAAGRITLELRVVEPRSLGREVPPAQWQGLLSSLDSASLSGLFTPRLQASVSQEQRQLAIFTHLLDAVKSHPEVGPDVLCVFLRVAYPNDSFLEDAFKWFRAEHLTEGHLAALRDPMLLLRLAEAKGHAVASVLRAAPQEVFQSLDNLHAFLGRRLDSTGQKG
jgi:hypothetical protein